MITATKKTIEIVDALYNINLPLQASTDIFISFDTIKAQLITLENVAAFDQIPIERVSHMLVTFYKTPEYLLIHELKTHKGIKNLSDIVIGIIPLDQITNTNFLNLISLNTITYGVNLTGTEIVTSSRLPDFSGIKLLDNFIAADYKELYDVFNIFYTTHLSGNITSRRILNAALPFYTKQKFTGIKELSAEFRADFFIPGYNGLDLFNSLFINSQCKAIVKFLTGTTIASVAPTMYVSLQNGGRYLDVPLNGLCEVTDVSTVNNSRVFIYQRCEMQRVNHNYTTNVSTLAVEYAIRIIDSSHPSYNYVDPGRMFLDNHNYHDTYKPVLGSYILVDIPTKFPGGNKMYLYKSSFRDKINTLQAPFLIAEKDLNDILLENGNATQRKNNISASSEAERKEKEFIQNKIISKAQGVIAGTGQLKLNDITFSPEAFEYAGQTIKVGSEIMTNVLNKFLIKGGYLDHYGNVMSKKLDVTEYENMNFDAVMETMLTSLEKVKRDFTISNIDIKYEVQTNRSYLNSERINTDEVAECLKRALNYSDPAEYNAFLDTVSKCSLNMHSYLQSGLEIKIYDHRTMSRNYFKLIFPLKRIKNKNFIEIDSRLFKIKNTAKFLRLENLTELSTILEVLTNNEIVENLDTNLIKRLIKEGLEIFKIKHAAAAEFLRKTEKKFNLVKQPVTLNSNIRLENAYIIKGHLKTYCLDADRKHDVFSYPEGKHICMIDKSTTASGNDKLIGRIYALANDKVVSEQITTLTEEEE